MMQLYWMSAVVWLFTCVFFRKKSFQSSRFSESTFYTDSFCLFVKKSGSLGQPSDPDYFPGPDLFFLWSRFSMYSHVESILWETIVWWQRHHCGAAVGVIAVSRGQQRPPLLLPLWDQQCPSPSVAIVVVVVAWSLLSSLLFGVIVGVWRHCCNCCWHCRFCRCCHCYHCPRCPHCLCCYHCHCNCHPCHNPYCPNCRRHHCPCCCCLLSTSLIDVSILSILLQWSFRHRPCHSCPCCPCFLDHSYCCHLHCHCRCHLPVPPVRHDRLSAGSTPLVRRRRSRCSPSSTSGATAAAHGSLLQCVKRHAWWLSWW